MAPLCSLVQHPLSGIGKWADHNKNRPLDGQACKAVGAHGDFAFAPPIYNHKVKLTEVTFRSIPRSDFIQTKSFLNDIPLELRNMIYNFLLASLRDISGIIPLRISGSSSHLPYHPTRYRHDVAISSRFYIQACTSAPVYESLRNLSNTSLQIRYELGLQFYRNVILEAPDIDAQQHLGCFFRSRPAVHHLKLLDLGTWKPFWSYNRGHKIKKDHHDLDRIEMAEEEMRKIGVFRSLTGSEFHNLRLDVIKMHLTMFDHYTSRDFDTPHELLDANIVNVLSTYNPFCRDNFSRNLVPSIYPWVNVFRYLSEKIQKRLDLMIFDGDALDVTRVSSMGMYERERENWIQGGFYTERLSYQDGEERRDWQWVSESKRCPLLQWHLCPRKRPTFISILAELDRDEGEVVNWLGRRKGTKKRGEHSWLPEKVGSDLGYGVWGLG